MNLPNVLPVSHFHLASSQRLRESFKRRTDFRKERRVFTQLRNFAGFGQSGCSVWLQVRAAAQKQTPALAAARVWKPLLRICDSQSSQQHQPFSRAHRIILSRRETSTSFRALSIPALPAPASDRYSSGAEFSWAPFPAPALPHFSWNTNSSVVPPQQLCSCQLWHLAESRQPLVLSSDLLNCHFSFSTISTIHLLERKLPYEVLLK